MPPRTAKTPNKERRRVFIREWRGERTLEEVAERVNTTHTSLSRVERGLQDYTQSLLEGLAREFGCTPEDLLSGPPPDPSKKTVSIDAPPDLARELAAYRDGLLKGRKS